MVINLSIITVMVNMVNRSTFRCSVSFLRTWREDPFILVLYELLEVVAHLHPLLARLLPAGVGGAELLDSVRVPQRVEGVLA